MSIFEPIFRDAVVSVAGVTVYEKAADSLGRYVVAKIMKLPTGKVLRRQSYYRQRPAALNYARKFLEQRAAKAGVPYVPGDGAHTMAFSPISA